MNTFKFIPVSVLVDKTDTQLQFINCDHIQRIWQNEDTVYIEMVDYTVLQVPNENLHNLIERFIRS
jgi:hypothetical protein